MQLASYLDGMQLMWMTHVNPKPDDLFDNDQNHVLSFYKCIEKCLCNILYVSLFS